MRRLYSFMVICAAPIAFAIVLWKGLRDRGYWRGLRQRFGFGPAVAHSPCIWLHAVSLGEMSAAAPLIRAIRVRFPQFPVVLTTATPAGRLRAQGLFGDSVDLRFLPYDTPGSVRRFLTRIRPRLAIIMETELWPNLFGECERRGVPVILASARLSAKSVARYARTGKLFSSVFTDNVVVAAQSAGDAQRFQSIGAPAALVHVIGNVKFDLELDAAVVDAGRELRAARDAGRPTWVAGSTHAGEEEQVLAAHALLLRQVPAALLLLAPRHKDRFGAVADLLSRQGLHFARRSSGEAPGEGAAVMLIDTVGELNLVYASADVAFVGGSLVPIGGHNLLEPAALGLPVLTGPFQFNNKEIARLLLERGAAREVRDANRLAAELEALLGNTVERQRMGAIGQEIIAANRGSVTRLLSLMEPSLQAAAAVVYPSAVN
jgi:3-deoxy-D-manno-octulosonic-acid transferase